MERRLGYYRWNTVSVPGKRPHDTTKDMIYRNFIEENVSGDIQHTNRLVYINHNIQDIFMMQRIFCYNESIRFVSKSQSLRGFVGLANMTVNMDSFSHSLVFLIIPVYGKLKPHLPYSIVIDRSLIFLSKHV